MTTNLAIQPSQPNSIAKSHPAQMLNGVIERWMGLGRGWQLDSARQSDSCNGRFVDSAETINLSRGDTFV